MASNETRTNTSSLSGITPFGILSVLPTLKSLRFTNTGKLTDAGMETFAGLKNLENFSFVGTAITGRCCVKQFAR